MNQHFTLFGLPETFQIDENALETRYRTLAANCHPDKFASASAFEQKQAVMMAAAFDAQQYQTAAQLVRQGRFLNKIRQEIENAA